MTTGDRYDHRDGARREEDATEPTIDAPVLAGVEDIRADAKQALRSGDVEKEPSDAGESLAEIADPPGSDVR